MDNLLLDIIYYLSQISSAIGRNDVNLTKFNDAINPLKQKVIELSQMTGIPVSPVKYVRSREWESSEHYLIDCYRYFGKRDNDSQQFRYLSDMYRSILLLQDKITCPSLELENLE